jgi:hypothetical protein
VAVAVAKVVCCEVAWPSARIPDLPRSEGENTNILSNFLLYILPLLHIRFKIKVVFPDPGRPHINMKKLSICGKGLGIDSSMSSQEKLNLLKVIFFSGSTSLIFNLLIILIEYIFIQI